MITYVNVEQTKGVILSILLSGHLGKKNYDSAQYFAGRMGTAFGGPGQGLAGVIDYERVLW